MTGLHADPPRRGVEDKDTRPGRFTGWWRRWKDIIIVSTAFPACALSLFLGWKVYGVEKARGRDERVVRIIVQAQAKIAAERAADQEATATAARASCLRTRRFAPAIADDYERRHVFPMKVIEQYRASIPKSCPAK